MSGYGEMAKDVEQARFLNKWVPPEDPILAKCSDEFREQYRFTLARARAAEAELKKYQRFFSNMSDFLDMARRSGF